MKLIAVFLISIFAFSFGEEQLPNIIFILADDLGFNDIGYQNSKVITPNIDSLAASGVILERNYVQTVCSPSRAAFLTGMYPYKIGRQGKLPLRTETPTGLTLERTILPEYLKEVGYTNHLIGKWHLGYCKSEFTPIHRGFDSFYGYWAGGIDYYTKVGPKKARDFHFNDNQLQDFGNYSVDLYNERMREVIRGHNESNPLFLYLAMQNVHTPLQVPDEYTEMYPNEHNPNRKKLLGMVTNMDDAIGTLIEELKAKGLYENSILIFSSDNGGQNNNGAASNFPLRSGKGTYYEGGVRVPAFVHSPKYIKNPGRIHDKLVHISDWLPTILSVAGVDVEDSFDGVDQFQAIFEDDRSSIPRTSVVNDFSTTTIWNFQERLSGAIQFEGGWKVLRNPGVLNLFDAYSMYNVIDDPEESIELSSKYPELFEELKGVFEEMVKEMVPLDNPDALPDTDITDGNGNLATGWCNSI